MGGRGLGVERGEGRVGRSFAGCLLARDEVRSAAHLLLPSLAQFYDLLTTRALLPHCSRVPSCILPSAGIRAAICITATR